MVGRLLRPFLGALAALALLGMLVVAQALMPASCECMHEISPASQPCADHSQVPCKGIAATCAGCDELRVDDQPARATNLASGLAWMVTGRLLNRQRPALWTLDQAYPWSSHHDLTA
jgi:hypothetical protein